MSTHVLVLAATYPELKAVLERVMKQPLNSESFAAYQQSMVHAPIIFDFVSVVQTHASNYQNINLTLKKIDEIIERIGKIDYAQLTDSERDDLPELAKKVDNASDKIRKEVSPKLVEDKKGLLEILNKELVSAGKYLASVGQLLDVSLDTINKEFGLKLVWTEGKKVVNWFELEDWLDKKAGGKWKTEVLGTKEDKLPRLLQGILMAEYLTSNTKQDEAMINKVLGFIAKIPLEESLFKEVTTKKGSYVDAMEKTKEEVQRLYEVLFEYPIEADPVSDEASQDLDRLSKQSKLFTRIDKPVEG